MVLEIKDSRKAYRSRLEIVRDILLVMRDKTSKKTRVMLRANLSYKLLTRYLDYVLRAGFVTCEGSSDYMLTDKGRMFLKLYDDYEKKRDEAEKTISSLEDGKESLEKMLNLKSLQRLST